MKTVLVSAFLGCLSLIATSVLPAGRADACTRTFAIFFDPGSTEISGRGPLMAEEFSRYFVDRAPSGETPGVGACGSLDPAGDYKVVISAHAHDPNIRDQCALSLARGHVVRALLAALGIPEASMALEAFGDRRPLVEIRPGVWDRQNRYVTLYVVRSDRVIERSPYPRLRERPDGSCPGR